MSFRPLKILILIHISSVRGACTYEKCNHNFSQCNHYFADALHGYSNLHCISSANQTNSHCT